MGDFETLGGSARGVFFGGRVERLMARLHGWGLHLARIEMGSEISFLANFILLFSPCILGFSFPPFLLSIPPPLSSCPLPPHFRSLSVSSSFPPPPFSKKSKNETFSLVERKEEEEEEKENKKIKIEGIRAEK